MATAQLMYSEAECRAILEQCCRPGPAMAGPTQGAAALIRGWFQASLNKFMQEHPACLRFVALARQLNQAESALTAANHARSDAEQAFVRACQSPDGAGMTDADERRRAAATTAEIQEARVKLLTPERERAFQAMHAAWKDSVFPTLNRAGLVHFRTELDKYVERFAREHAEAVIAVLYGYQELAAAVASYTTVGNEFRNPQLGALANLG